MILSGTPLLLTSRAEVVAGTSKIAATLAAGGDSILSSTASVFVIVRPSLGLAVIKRYYLSVLTYVGDAG